MTRTLNLGFLFHNNSSTKLKIEKIVRETTKLLKFIRMAFHCKGKMMIKLTEAMICPKLKYAAVLCH